VTDDPAFPATRDFLLFCSMKSDDDGLPVVGSMARTRGARPAIDIPVDGAGWVLPNSGGMLVAPNDPRNLPRHRRPPPFGGTGSDPVWATDMSALSSSLTYRADPLNALGHGFIEPAEPMTLQQFQNALEATRDSWKEYSE
jgi:hypothetical protein